LDIAILGVDDPSLGAAVEPAIEAWRTGIAAADPQPPLDRLVLRDRDPRGGPSAPGRLRTRRRGDPEGEVYTVARPAEDDERFAGNNGACSLQTRALAGSTDSIPPLC
jgi:hypothetical protein